MENEDYRLNEDYELDITDLIGIPCRRAYIRMAEKYENGHLLFYDHMGKEGRASVSGRRSRRSRNP